MEVVGAAITALAAIVVAIISRGTRKDARAVREENAVQHAAVQATIKTHTTQISGLQTDVSDLKADVRDVKSDVREMRTDVRSLLDR